MRAKPSSSTRSSKTSRANSKSHGVSKGVVKKGSKEMAKKAVVPDLSVLRQPVDTSICGLKQAVKVFETGTPEVLHLLTYDCDVVYECKVCRNLFRSIANFISHKRVYCTLRYSLAQDTRSNKEGDFTLILGEKAQERLPTRITARKDLTSIVESLGGQKTVCDLQIQSEVKGGTNAEKKATTIHLEPMENTSYGVFQTVLKPDGESLMGHQVNELQKLLSQNEVILGPDGRILQNGLSDLCQEQAEPESNTENNLVCSVCGITFATRKTLTRHVRIMHESVRSTYTCPCCKNLFSNPWSVYRHLYKVHKKTNEQVRRLRAQIHKNIKVEKPIVSSVNNNKKNTSPTRKRTESEQNNRVQQDNKEWMDHFEDDWELQRCGGCGRKFERKAALLSHAQICQKRILACNRIEQNYRGSITSATAPIPVVALTPLTCSKKPIPKPSPEKKIGIQVRMNYCKSGSQISERHQACTRSLLGDESDLEVVSIDGKDNFFQQTSLKENSMLDQFFKTSNLCHATDRLDKVNSYLNEASNGIDKLHTYEIPTCKTSTVLRSNVGKNKSLEEKCLQLRSVLENGTAEIVKSETKAKDETPTYFDGNIDNTSESNTSAVSSLSSQFTPPGDKEFICDGKDSIEIKDNNVSRSLENIPSTEADSTSMSNGNSLQTPYDPNTYTGNVKYSSNDDATCEEVSTSLISDDVTHTNSNLVVDSSCIQDDEISVDLKPIDSLVDDLKNSIKEIELESTISILTRNQLKAICKDDLVPDNQQGPRSNTMKKRNCDFEMESATRETIKKKLSKYVNEKQNRCTVCLKKFRSQYKVYRHIPTHTQWKRYECLHNGCTFQTFLKKACLHHVTLHTRDSKESSLSLVGEINPSRWNLKIIKTKNPPQPGIDKKSNSIIHKKDIASEELTKTLVSQKLVKAMASKKLAKTASQKLAKTLASKRLTNTVNKLTKHPQNLSRSLKAKSKSKENLKVISNKLKKSKLVNRVNVKQKLLTDYKHFNKGSKISKEKILNTKTNKVKNEQRPKKKIPLNSSKLKRFNLNPAENGNIDAEASNLGNPSAVRKHKVSTSNIDQPKMKLAVIKKEKEEIIINNLSCDSSDPNIGMGRASRASSRKSSVNSIDQPRGKSLVSTVVKLEDCNTYLNAPVNFESQNSIHIHSPEIIDGSSSQEEEESQDSDKPVDVKHLKKIVMEVIFGASPKPTQASGRPVRNKSRPKRDNDFVLGSQKEGDKEVVEAKAAVNKKSAKALSESRSQSDISKKPK